MQILLKHNHRLADIRGYTIDQFIVFLDAAERSDAMSRIMFTMDMSVVVGGVLGGHEALNEHLTSLQNTAKGE